MAGTEWYFLTGKGSWVSPHKINQWGKYSMKLYPNAESLALLLQLQKDKGIKNKIEQDDDGWWVRLNRPSELKLRTGKLVGMNPPEVNNRDSNILDVGYAGVVGGDRLLHGRLPYGNMPIKDDAGKIVAYAPLTEPIGNGSDVVAKVEVYPYTPPASRDGKKEWAMRWFSVRVDHLIPFNKPSFDEGGTNAVMGFETQGKQLF